MFKITLVSGLFGGNATRSESNRVMEHALSCLTLIDEDFLRAHPETPRLYDSGVFYKPEPPPEENWQDVPTTIARRFGDCEDLACWLAAERRVKDHAFAWPHFTWRRLKDGRTLYHIVVKHADGRIEDPSRQLGMLDR